jgi:hypothetical protein
MPAKDDQRTARKLLKATAFKETLETFAYNSPVGSYKVDTFIERVKVRRAPELNIFRMRKGIWRSAFLSSLNEDNSKGQPAWIREARDFLNNLTLAKNSLVNAWNADVDHISRTLLFIPDNPEDLSQHRTYQTIEREFVNLNADLRTAHERLTNYLERNVLPPNRKRPTNAADHFMRGFIELSAIVWAEEFRSPLRKEDQADFVGILGTALDDFKYPLSDKQRRDDDWLRDRVRKQLFGK